MGDRNDLNMKTRTIRRYKRMVFCVAIMVCLSTMAMLGFHYRFHFLWIYTRHRFNLNQTIPFQSRQMPYVPVPSTWGTHNIGKMELSLPPEFHTNNIAMDELRNARVYRHETKSVFISFPDDYGDTLEMVNASLNMYPQHSIPTLPRLRYECYRTSSTEFNWAMSSSDVYWYIFCATFIKAFQIMQYGHTEILFDDGIDRIAMINGNKTVFEWQCKNTSLGGYIHFYNGDEAEINDADNDWIRAVCQSLKIVDSLQNNEP